MKRIIFAVVALALAGCASTPRPAGHTPPDYSRPAIIALPADVPAFDHSKPLERPWWETAPILKFNGELRRICRKCIEA